MVTPPPNVSVPRKQPEDGLTSENLGTDHCIWSYLYRPSKLKNGQQMDRTISEHLAIREGSIHTQNLFLHNTGLLGVRRQDTNLSYTLRTVSSMFRTRVYFRRCRNKSSRPGGTQNKLYGGNSQTRGVSQAVGGRVLGREAAKRMRWFEPLFGNQDPNNIKIRANRSKYFTS